MKGSSTFLKTFFPRLLPHHSATLAFSNRVGFLFQIAVWFLSNSWTVRGVRAVHSSECSSLGVRWGIEEESSGFQTPLNVRHGSGKPWRVVVLKHTDGMQDFQGLNVIKNSLSWMIITPMVLIDSFKVYEIICPRVSIFDFVSSRLQNVFIYTWVGSIYVAMGTLWEPSNASWN